MGFLNRQVWGRALLVAAALAVGAVCWSGCGGDDNPADNNGGNNSGNSNTGGNNNNIGGDTLSCGTRECKSAVMPDGQTWMTENLNKTTDGSWCYENSPDSCAKYGRLYTWSAAKAACQSVGMRLPTNAEWGALVTAAGGSSVAGKALKADHGWYNNGNGTDMYGFSALPGGDWRSNGSFLYAGLSGLWWTATEGPDGSAYSRYIDYNYDYVYEDNDYKNFGFSVRCVQN